MTAFHEQRLGIRCSHKVISPSKTSFTPVNFTGHLRSALHTTFSPSSGVLWDMGFAVPAVRQLCVERATLCLSTASEAWERNIFISHIV